jgi:hypothetical protein
MLYTIIRTLPILLSQINIWRCHAAMDFCIVIKHSHKATDKLALIATSKSRRQLAQSAVFLICIRDAPASDIGRYTNYSGWRFHCGGSSFLRDDFQESALKTSRSICSHLYLFLIHLTILRFDTIQKALLNKGMVKKTPWPESASELYPHRACMGIMRGHSAA